MQSVINYIFSASFVVSVLRISTPLLFCSMAAVIVKKSGVVCICYEAMMVMAALGGVLGSYWTQTLIGGMAVGIALSMFIAMLFAYFALVLQADKMLVSLALNTFGSGGSLLLLYAVTGEKGNTARIKSLQFPTIEIPFIKDIPVLGEILSGRNLMTYLAFLVVPLVSILLFKTSFGLRIRAAGENENAAKSLGTDVLRVRITTLMIASVLAAMGGMFMSMGYVPYFTRDMIAGRGFMSIAANNLGGNMPGATMIWALVFGISNAIANAFQALNLPSELLQMFPYAATLIGLMIVGIVNISSQRKLTKTLVRKARESAVKK